MRVLKKIFLLIFSVFIIMNCCSCKEIKNYLQTDIAFDKEKVFLLDAEHLAEITDNSVNIYSIAKRAEQIEYYDKVSGSYYLSDFTGSLMLLQNTDELLFYNLETKETIDIFNSVFPENETETVFKFNAFFSNDGEKIIVSKILLDISKPIMTAGVRTGFAVSEKSGIYVYNIKSKNVELEKTININDMGLQIPENKEISFTASEIDETEISLVLRIYPATVPFYEEYFYKIDLSNSAVIKIGHTPFEESQDFALQYSYLENRIVKADSKQVICVDFENEKMHKFQFDELVGVTGVDILETENKNFFFINISRNTKDYIYKFKLISGVLNCETGKDSMLATENLLQNAFVRGNKLYFPSDEQARKYGTLFVNGTTYRSYSDRGYLCESGGKTVIVLESSNKIVMKGQGEEPYV